MITVDFSKQKDKGLCEQLYDTIKAQIFDSTLAPNSKLPSKRTLASHLGVSVITVQNAYAQLISEGFIYSIEKKGFFVTDISDFEVPVSEPTPNRPALTPPPAQNTYITDFISNATNAEKFPFAVWSHTLRQVLNSGDEKLLERSDIRGCYELRKAICEYLLAFRNLQISPEQVVIGAGTEALYSMLVQFLGRDKIYAVENPGYKKTKSIFELNGANCIPVEIDNHGVTTESLNKHNVQIAHISPNHHFPTGVVMPVRRRMELLAWVNENQDRYLIEDDYDSEFRFNGKPLPTLQSSDTQNKIFYMNTFSKTLSPSFRISYLVLPRNLTEAFVEKLGAYSCQVSSFEQFTLARFISEGLYEKHINRMKNHYRTLRNNLIFELEKSALMPLCEIKEEEAGLHFLLKIKTKKTPGEIKAAMQKNGINVSLLRDYYYEDSEAAETENCTLVINYSALKKELISQTVSRMALAVINVD